MKGQRRKKCKGEKGSKWMPGIRVVSTEVTNPEGVRERARVQGCYRVKRVF